MRTLTIKRHNSVVSTTKSAKIYVDNSSTVDLVINGIPCRKIGEVKNGEEQSFLISENEQGKVFIVNDDKQTETKCVWDIAAGYDSVYLTCKAVKDSAGKSVFVFDSATDGDGDIESEKDNSKQRLKNIIIAVSFCALIALVALIIMDKNDTPDNYIFTTEGMTIVLNEGFTPTGVEDAVICYSSSDVNITTYKDSFEGNPDAKIMSVADYANALIKDANITADVKTKDGVTYFEYQKEGTDGKLYKYYVSVYKTETAFWNVEMRTYENVYNDHVESFETWAKSVSFVK